MPESDPAASRLTMGWREWLALPDLGIQAVKAKVDTGARSSSLHAYDVNLIERDGVTWVQFQVHPFQRDAKHIVSTEAPLLEFRRVKSSTGHMTKRPVIVTRVQLLGQTWPIELTLANRDEMGFRMLLGRQAIRGRFLVDPGKSYINGDLRKSARKKKQKKRRFE